MRVDRVSLAYETDTITAIATPIGEGGLSVIRLSGPRAIELAATGFRGKHPLTEAPTQTAHFGTVVDEQGLAIDQVVVLIFRNPHSYTGEDVVEISCHGGMYVTRQILEATIRHGARPAQPGEFTKRAFLNGKIDLAQAEAIADLIHARSETAHRSSLRQLQGDLTGRIATLQDQLMDTIGLLELELDFAEDGYEFVDKERVARQVSDAIAYISELISTYQVGKIYREGIRTVLAGAPNVGKSSLLNALLLEERAIVTDLPGTTRDVIEESLTIGGVLFTVTDTAGLRQTDDPIEKEGVRRADQKIESSDLVLLVLDSSNSSSSLNSPDTIDLINKVRTNKSKCIIVANKQDLVKESMFGSIIRDKTLETFPRVNVSAKTHDGLQELRSLMLSSILDGIQPLQESSVIVTNSRHYAALLEAKSSLEKSMETLKANQSGEFITVDLRAALDFLGEIGGVKTTDDILNRVFSSFCIGK